MHIRRLDIKNIRAIEHLGLDLTSSGSSARRRLIILGANGSGKTTILNAISHFFAEETEDTGTTVRLNVGDVRTSRAQAGTSAEPLGSIGIELCITPEEQLAFVAPKRNDPHGAIARMWKVMGTYIPDMPRPVDVHGLRMLFETPDGTIVSLPQLSDGQRAVLLLMGELAVRNPAQGVVLIDEIEQHLHPRWQQAIIEALLAPGS